MKIFTNLLVVFAIGLIIFNISLLDYHNPLKGNSIIPLIGIVAAICAILIIIIFKMSKSIEQKTNDKS